MNRRTFLRSLFLAPLIPLARRLPVTGPVNHWAEMIKEQNARLADRNPLYKCVITPNIKSYEVRSISWDTWVRLQQEKHGTWASS